MLRQHTGVLPRCGQGKAHSLCDGIKPQGSSRECRLAISLSTRQGVVNLDQPGHRIVAKHYACSTIRVSRDRTVVT